MNSNQELRIEARETTDRSVAQTSALQVEGQALLGASRPKPSSSAEPDIIEFSNVYEQTRVNVDRAEPRTLAARPLASANSFSLDETDKPPTARSWTVAVSLTTSMEDSRNEPNSAAGAQKKLQEILALAEQTRNSPVTIYVQAAESGTSLIGSKNSPTAPMVNTYRLEAGVVTQVASQPSAGLTNDLAGLLDRAGKRAGNGNLGLILQSHGVAEQGVFGDTGRASLPQLESTIQTSLSARGRSQLDLLNFDSCLMANSAVVQTMQGEARNIVASAQTESVVNGADGQNLKATLSALLVSPNLSSREFAIRSVELARQGANDDLGNAVRDASGTDTLASIDVSRYQNFESQVNRFSQDLLDAGKDPVNRRGIIQAINNTDALGSGGTATPLYMQRKDMGLILNQLEAGIRQGTIIDRDNKLTEGIALTRHSLREMISQYHGESYRNYSEMAGISVAVPNRDMFDLKSLANSNSNIGQSVDFIERRITENDFGHAKETIELLGPMIANLPRGGSTSLIEGEMKGLTEAGNEREFFLHLKRIKSELESLQASPQGQQEAQAELVRLQEQRTQIMNRQNGKLPAGWLTLMNSLSHP